MSNGQTSSRDSCNVTAPSPKALMAIANLQFNEAIRVAHGRDGKLEGRWDAIAWLPLVAVATAQVALVGDLLRLCNENAVVERRPYAWPGETEAEMGSDVICIADREVPSDLLARLRAACIGFSNSVLNLGDPRNDQLEYSGRLSQNEREVVMQHVDKFRGAWGGKQIQEEFVCAIGETQILFAKCFCPKLVVDSGLPTVIDVVAKLEGVERKDKRITCNLLLLLDRTRRKASLTNDTISLEDLKRCLWDNGAYRFQVIETTTASGERNWDLFSVGECVQPGASLL